MEGLSSINTWDQGPGSGQVIMAGDRSIHIFMVELSRFLSRARISASNLGVKWFSANNQSLREILHNHMVNCTSHIIHAEMSHVYLQQTRFLHNRVQSLLIMQIMDRI